MVKLPQWGGSRINWIKSPPRWTIAVGSIFLGSAGTAFFLWFLLVLLPNRNVPITVSEDAKRRADLINSNRENVLKVVQTFAGLGFIATAYLAWQNYKLTEDKNVTDRFSKAVEMLASEKLEVRLGGIYSLERIARDSQEDHPVVVELLVAFIRARSMRSQEPDGFLLDYDYAPDRDDEPEYIKQDIQSALLVLARRKAEYDAPMQDINLSGTHLYGAKLVGAKLKKANLSHTELTSAYFVGANLAFAALRNAKLRNTYFLSAQLERTFLTDADLSVAYLTSANLKNAKLQRANLHGANLTGADLSNANLSHARLDFADLRAANLTGAELNKADLKDITWNHATDWNQVSGLDEACNVPEDLKKHIHDSL